MSNNLKRKLRCLMNESCLLDVTVMSENTIMNHLIKKMRSNELKLFSVENLTDETDASQTFKKTSSSFKCKL